MDRLILLFLQRRATPEERRRLSEWRRSRPQHDRRFREIEELWMLLEHAAPEPVPASLPEGDELIARAERRVNAQAASPPLGRPRIGHAAWPNGRTRRLVAGAVAASLIGAAFGLGRATDWRPTPEPVVSSSVTTGPGERTTLRLSDGTSIRLGPRSRLRIRRTAEEREVWLDGRAFFAVETDSTRLFKVQTDYGEATVFGTRFEVRTEKEAFRVLVVEGRVAVSAGGAAVELREGEMSRAAAGSAPSTMKVTNIYDQLEWMGNALVFQATPLHRAAAEIERRYGVTISLLAPELADLAITATFTDARLEDVVMVLCEAIGARCVVQADTIQIDDPRSARRVRAQPSDP